MPVAGDPGVLGPLEDGRLTGVTRPSTCQTANQKRQSGSENSPVYWHQLKEKVKTTNKPEGEEDLTRQQQQLVSDR